MRRFTIPNLCFVNHLLKIYLLIFGNILATTILSALVTVVVENPKSNKHPVSIWGWGTKGTRTRKPGPTKGLKNSNKMVVRQRPRGKEKQGLA